MGIYFDCVNRFSAGARALAEALNAKRLREHSRYRARPKDIIINWGHSNPRNYRGRAYYNHVVPAPLNNPASVALASNKLETFKKFLEAAVPTPKWTDSYETAYTWVKEGNLVVSRALLRASEGRGMAVSPVPQREVGGLPVKLWTKYYRGREFRVHVFNGKAIDIQQKKRANGSGADAVIRSHANGWVFCREGVNELPERELISNLAVQGIKALSLDFGAVDIRYSVKKNQAVILEVNTTPGLEGTTLESYSKAIKEYQDELE